MPTPEPISGKEYWTTWIGSVNKVEGGEWMVNGQPTVSATDTTYI